jgi:HEAT repeat protein
MPSPCSDKATSTLGTGSSLGFAGGIDAELRIALWVGVGAFLFTLLLLLQIALLRQLAARRQRQRQVFARCWRPLLNLAALGETITPPRLTRRHRIDFLLLWNEIRESVRGEAEPGLSRLAKAVGADRSARELLAKGNAGERLLALLTLGRLGDPADIDRVAAAARSSDTYVSMAAAQALVLIDPTRAVHDLLPLVARRTDWQPARIVALLGNVNAEILSPVLVKLLRRVPSPALPRLLPLLTAVHSETAEAVLGKVFARARTPELLIAALKLARTPGTLAAVHHCLGHKDWQVRAQAAAALGRVGSWRDMERLVPLLQDREWWVRYRAAQAVMCLPGVSANDLRVLSDRLQDRFARDMLAHAAGEIGPSPLHPVVKA